MDRFGGLTIKNIKIWTEVERSTDGRRSVRGGLVKPEVLYCEVKVSSVASRCEGVWLLMTSHFSKKIFFGDLGMSVTVKSGLRPIKSTYPIFLIVAPNFSYNKTSEKNKRSFVILCDPFWFE